MIDSLHTCDSTSGAGGVNPPGRRASGSLLERVANVGIVQLTADGFDQLGQRDRVLSYYLYQASLAGRDIAIDQRHPRALEVRELFEFVLTRNAGMDALLEQQIRTYLKLFWIHNGFYDSYTSRKFTPDCSYEQFRQACLDAHGQSKRTALSDSELMMRVDDLREVIFDPECDPILTNKTPGADWITGSASNLYQRGISYAEVTAWETAGNERFPLNSRIERNHDGLMEHVWRAGDDGIPPGMYARELEEVIRNLTLALPYASGEYQRETILLLIRYFRSGNPEDFRSYNIHWVKDTSPVDIQIGFIEVYLDPRGKKGEWEALPSFVHAAQTSLMQKLAALAQHFEDNAPWDDAYKKQITHVPVANVTNVIVGTGGTGPLTPLGVNLPNEQFIREHYGSKSVLLQNVSEAADRASSMELVSEFASGESEVRNQEMYGHLADALHTALHEVIGHGSGKVSPALGGRDPGSFLPGYYNTLEEARADLVALWHVWDMRLIETGIASDSKELRALAETMYQQAIRVSLTQLRRIGNADQLEEDHMKARQLIAHWLLRNSGGVQVEQADGVTRYRITDLEKLRISVGHLLSEVMRAKAEGDIHTAKTLIDAYGLRVDTSLRDEVQSRAARLNVPDTIAFVMPELMPVCDAEGEVIDARMVYPENFEEQMLRFSRQSRDRRTTMELQSQT